MEKAVVDKLKYLINKKKSLDEICFALDFEPNEVFEYMKYLKIMGYDYDFINGVPFKLDPNIGNYKIDDSVGNVINVCFVSDPHLGSIYDRPDVLQYVYDECDRRGVELIFCSGDYTDGFYPDRPSYMKQQKVHGYEQMLDYVLNVHPYSRYIKFYTISGNHDNTFTFSDNKDICEEVSKLRDDFIYLGKDCADVNLGNLSLRLYHGYGKARDTLCERARKYYDSLDDENIPDIIQMGHIHHSFYTTFDYTHVFQTAALTDQISYIGKRNMGIERSCWFAQIEVDDYGNIINVIPELVSFGPKLVKERKL